MSADVYASFGVNNAVISSSDPVEHEQNMLAMDVAVRSGDDSFELVEEEQSTDDNRQEIKISTDPEETPEGDEQADPEDAPEGTDESGEEAPLGEPNDELKAASEQISEYAEGFRQMREQAVKAGLDPAVATRIESEYEENNMLSEESLKALEAVGYSRGFVRSFIQGQEALAQSYVSQIVAFAGGQERFDSVVKHLQSTSPDSIAALESAIERQDLASVKAIINLGIASRTKKFGKQPERSVTRKAPAVPAQAAPKGPQGFDNQAAMVKAMSDPRYSRDAKYRAEVEARVARSSW